MIHQDQKYQNLKKILKKLMTNIADSFKDKKRIIKELFTYYFTTSIFSALPKSFSKVCYHSVSIHKIKFKYLLHCVEWFAQVLILNSMTNCFTD